MVYFKRPVLEVKANTLVRKIKSLAVILKHLFELMGGFAK